MKKRIVMATDEEFVEVADYKKLEEAAHRLAMMVLQSAAYLCPDMKDATDDVLAITEVCELATSFRV